MSRLIQAKKCVQSTHLFQMMLCSNIPTSTSSRKPTAMTSASYESGIVIRISVLSFYLGQRAEPGMKR